VLERLEQKGSVKIAGARYNLAAGAAAFL